jgi:hypothetical protein
MTGSALRSALPVLAGMLLLASGCSSPTAASPAGAPSPSLKDEVAIDFGLPKPVFIGTPKAPPAGVKLDPALQKDPKRGPYMAPKDVVNISQEKAVTASDKEPIIGEIKQITDGDKEGASGSYVEFGPGLQWAQVDLGARHEIFPILIWFYHGDPRIYRDVIVQVSDDADFIQNVQTLFNNDFDNSAGMGVGNDYEFYETNEGKLVDGRHNGKPAVARYVRVYTKGSTADEMNRYTEIEVWGRPAK